MFDTDDFAKIDEQYFELIYKNCYHIRLKSKNTGHTWILYSKDLIPGYRSLEVWHQHRDTDRPHIQLDYHPKTIKQAQKMIRDHDRYVLETLKGKKK